ncbi:MAG: hypothetical protein HRU06_16265 [Oceanospirillaceae bacterium]|nr:hypothetical protein [Oceanospirillaceae bacterium]
MQNNKARRPQLSTSQAQQFSAIKVLEYTGEIGAERFDPWDPEGDDFMRGRASIKADFLVSTVADQNSKTQFSSIQAAVDAAIYSAIKKQSSARIYIKIDRGSYQGLVFVPKLEINNQCVPITLFADDANATSIVENIDAQMPATEFARRFAEHFAASHSLVQEMYLPIAQLKAEISTFNASVLRIANEGFQLKGVRVINSYHCDRFLPNASGGQQLKNSAGQFLDGQHQAVALLIAGADKVHVADVQLSSFQDTLFLREPGPFETARSYFKNCFIEGDIDFIFGQTTAFFTQCEIRSRGTRATMTYMSAPSTNIDAKYGLVFDDCDFTHDGSENALKGVFSLGRQWFEGVRCTPYSQSPIVDYQCKLGVISQYDSPPIGSISRKTIFSVGKCIILHSRIGEHINFSAPWSEWSGGEFSTAGVYLSAAWKTRFRPVQYCLDDMIGHLENWVDAPLLTLEKRDKTATWIAEYQNTDVSG